MSKRGGEDTQEEHVDQEGRGGEIERVESSRRGDMHLFSRLERGEGRPHQYTNPSDLRYLKVGQR